MPLCRTGHNPVCPAPSITLRDVNVHLPTKTSALTALAALAPAEQNLNQAETKRRRAYSPAAGESAYWPIATKMTSNAGAFGAVNGALGESQPPDSTMSSALNRTIPVMDAIKNEFVTASITAAASTLGATTTTVCSQRTYVSIPSVGSLVDAKMNEAAAKLATLQVQQQLGVQALRISHSNTQLILKLLEP